MEASEKWGRGARAVTKNTTASVVERVVRAAGVFQWRLASNIAPELSMHRLFTLAPHRLPKRNGTHNTCMTNVAKQ